LGAGAGIARADTVTLDVSGSLSAFNGASCSPSGCTLGGDIVINNTTGAFISTDVTMSGESPSVGPFSIFSGLAGLLGLTDLFLLTDDESTLAALVFATPTAGSLVGYDGGSLVAYNGGEPSNVNYTSVVQLFKPNSGIWLLNAGALTPVTAAEPNPFVLVLAGTVLVL
jgi:hypothetical protein